MPFCCFVWLSLTIADWLSPCRPVSVALFLNSIVCRYPWAVIFCNEGAALRISSRFQCVFWVRFNLFRSKKKLKMQQKDNKWSDNRAWAWQSRLGPIPSIFCSIKSDSCAQYIWQPAVTNVSCLFYSCLNDWLSAVPGYVILDCWKPKRNSWLRIRNFLFYLKRQCSMIMFISCKAACKYISS